MTAIPVNPGFLLFAAAVVIANALIVANHARFATGPVPEWPVMVDLLVFLPLAYLALNRRRGRAAVFGALTLAGVGVIAGSMMLPAESKHAWLIVEELRFAAIGIVVALQLGLIALVIAEVVRARHAQNFETTLDEAIGKRLGTDVFSSLLRLESRLWLYGLVRRPVRQAFPGSRHFHVGRQGMNASNQAAFLVLIGAEIPIAHALIHLFSPQVAILVTALSLYGFLFMLAEYRATLHRPISITEHGLHVRYGVVSDFLVPWDAIADIAPTRGPIRRASKQIRLYGMGEANVLLRLAPETRIAGLTGSRVVEAIHLGVDDPQGLIEEVAGRRRAD